MREKVPEAISIVEEFMKEERYKFSSGIMVVYKSLKYAEERGIFWEIINGTELDE